MNSIRSLENALIFERERQIAALEAGETLVQETRHWNEDDQKTTSMRSKEEAFDYRYFPEPDIPPLEPERAWVDEIRTSLPELPAARRERFEEEYSLKPELALAVASSRGTAEFYEEAVKAGSPASATANWMTQDVAAYLNEAKADLADTKLTPKHLADIVGLVSDGTISASGGKQVLTDVFETGDDAASIVEAKGLKQVSDTGELGSIADDVIAENPGPVGQFRGGKEGVIGFLVGQVMKKTGGSANPKVVQEVLRERLGSSS
jgi:aspartyl-tRNA(Asn)/glutamyl-tRNA(Gln) amidotransferase subunit B